MKTLDVNEGGGVTWGFMLMLMRLFMYIGYVTSFCILSLKITTYTEATVLHPKVELKGLLYIIHMCSMWNNVLMYKCQ